jgi:hypothetical protein
MRLSEQRDLSVVADVGWLRADNSAFLVLTQSAATCR